MSEQFIKQTLINKEHKRLSELKYHTKKRLEKLRAGGFKHKVKYTEQDLLEIIKDCDKKLNPWGYQGTRIIDSYPRLENYPNWNKEIEI